MKSLAVIISALILLLSPELSPRWAEGLRVVEAEGLRGRRPEGGEGLRAVAEGLRLRGWEIEGPNTRGAQEFGSQGGDCLRRRVAEKPRSVEATELRSLRRAQRTGLTVEKLEGAGAAEPRSSWTMGLRGGGVGELKKGKLVNFLNGEEVEDLEIPEVDSDHDMTGAVPVDWLPRGDFMLDEERQMLQAAEEEESKFLDQKSEEKDATATNSSLPASLDKAIKDLKKRVEVMWLRAEGLGIEALANCTQALNTFRRGRRKQLEQIQKFIPCVPLTLTEGPLGAGFHDPDGEALEGLGIEGFGYEGLGPASPHSLNKSAVLKELRRLQSGVSLRDRERRPEVDSLLRQIDRLEDVLIAVGQAKATLRSRPILQAMHQAVKEGEELLDKLFMPLGPAFRFLPLESLFASRTLLLSLTECSARISDLVLDKGEDLFIDLGGVGFQQVIENQEMQNFWREGPGGLLFSVPQAPFRSFFSAWFCKYLAKSRLEEQEAVGSLVLSPIWDAATFLLAEISIHTRVEGEVGIFALSHAFPSNVKVLLSLEALVTGAKLWQGQLKLAGGEGPKRSGGEGPRSLLSDLSAEDRAGLKARGRTYLKALQQQMVRYQREADYVLDSILLDKEIDTEGLLRIEGLEANSSECGDYNEILRRAHICGFFDLRRTRGLNTSVVQPPNPSGPSPYPEVDEFLLEKAEEGDAGGVLFAVLGLGASLGPSTPDPKGNTPLHSAAAQGHLHVVRLLVYLTTLNSLNSYAGSSKEEVLRLNSEGLTAQGLSARRGHKKVSEFLKGLEEGQLLIGPDTEEEDLVLRGSLSRLKAMQFDSDANWNKGEAEEPEDEGLGAEKDDTLEGVLAAEGLGADTLLGSLGAEGVETPGIEGDHVAEGAEATQGLTGLEGIEVLEGSMGSEEDKFSKSQPLNPAVPLPQMPPPESQPLPVQSQTPVQSQIAPCRGSAPQPPAFQPPASQGSFQTFDPRRVEESKSNGVKEQMQTGGFKSARGSSVAVATLGQGTKELRIQELRSRVSQPLGTVPEDPKAEPMAELSRGAGSQGTEGGRGAGRPRVSGAEVWARKGQRFMRSSRSELNIAGRPSRPGNQGPEGPLASRAEEIRELKERRGQDPVGVEPSRFSTFNSDYTLGPKTRGLTRHASATGSLRQYDRAPKDTKAKWAFDVSNPAAPSAPSHPPENPQ